MELSVPDTTAAHDRRIVMTTAALCAFDADALTFTAGDGVRWLAACLWGSGGGACFL